jgi:hypothetical protein
VVPLEELARHTRIPLPLRVGFRSGRLKILSFVLSRAAT